MSLNNSKGKVKAATSVLTPRIPLEKGAVFAKWSASGHDFSEKTTKKTKQPDQVKFGIIHGYSKNRALIAYVAVVDTTEEKPTGSSKPQPERDIWMVRKNTITIASSNLTTTCQMMTSSCWSITCTSQRKTDVEGG